MRYILIAVGLFFLAVLIRPDLGLFLFAGLVISIGAILYLRNANEERRFVAVNKTNSQDDDAAFSAVLAALQYPAYILDHRGAVRSANHASEEAFGTLNAGDLITIRFRQPELSGFIEQALKTSKPVSTNYSEPVPNDRWFAVDMAPIIVDAKDESPQLDLFILGFQDLTDAKRTEQMRSDFIANASHELRTPVASLLGYIETIRGPAKKDKKATERFLGIMQDQAERMTRLVNDLLSLSRIEMKSHVQPSGTVNITDVMETVIQSLEELARQMNIEINFNKPDDVYIVGDRDELIQVFENLIENACKYGDEGGVVDISISHEQSGNPQMVTVKVRDYGPGIAIEDQQRITERFYRVDVARSREKQGTGLGLAIVKHILHRHKVRLALKSELGEGAEFSVTFPVSDASSEIK